MLNPTSSVVKWFFLFYQISECWRKLRSEFKLEDRRVAVRDPVLYAGQIVQNWAVILGLVEIGGVYNLFRRIYQYVEEICKEILFIGCFILRIYLQAFVLSTEKCAGIMTMNLVIHQRTHLGILHSGNNQATRHHISGSYRRFQWKNHWKSITT